MQNIITNIILAMVRLLLLKFGVMLMGFDVTILQCAGFVFIYENLLYSIKTIVKGD